MELNALKNLSFLRLIKSEKLKKMEKHFPESKNKKEHDS
jgi:hypothetical protein